jgi:hypothetical protein
MRAVEGTSNSLVEARWRRSTSHKAAKDANDGLHQKEYND